MRIGIVVSIAVATVGAVLAKQPSVQDLAGVELDISVIADSGSYFVYHYDLTNPPASTWGLAAIRLDIGASAGTPSNLATTGTFYDFTDGPGPAVAPHAAGGPITPSQWSATLTGSATLSWHPRTGAFTSEDSVAPGATKGGFGIRSSYLPGISSVVATPTPEACCTVPDSTVDGIIYPPRSRFAVTGWAVAPRYMPEEVDIELLQTQLTAICSDPLWLAISALCTEFEGLLDQAAGQFAGTDLYGAAISLSDLLERVEAEHQQMHANAYWLLYHNIHQAYANIADAGPSSLGASCTPSSVERATEVGCGPLLPIPPIGSTSDITGWRFVGGPAGEFVITPSGAPSSTWVGPLLTSGTIWVYATIDGVPDSASTAVTVTPRSWPLAPMDDPVVEIPDTHEWYNLPTPPRASVVKRPSLREGWSFGRFGPVVTTEPSLSRRN